MFNDTWRGRGEGMTLRDAMNRLFEDAFVSPSVAGTADGNAPARTPVNVYEDAEGYHVWALVPGVDANRINITAIGQSLVLEAESAADVPEAWRQLWTEWRPTRWRRELTMPAPVDAEKAEVTYEHGVLRLRIPKPEAARPRTLKVNVKSA